MTIKGGETRKGATGPARKVLEPASEDGLEQKKNLKRVMVHNVEGSGVSDQFNLCTISMFFFSYPHPKKPIDTSYDLFCLYLVISNNAVITHSILNFLLLSQPSLLFFF